MQEVINEPVNVLASFHRLKNNLVRVTPHKMSWRGRQYSIEKMGLYHPERRGEKRIHIFSFFADATNFRLELDPDTLEWTLAEVFYDR